jgi:hypothetical protein
VVCGVFVRAVVVGALYLETNRWFSLFVWFGLRLIVGLAP